jgi:predicted deacylase
LGEIILLPYANPIGMSQSLNGQLIGRYRFADGGGNFNRDWPDLSDAVINLVRGKLGDDGNANKPVMREALRHAVADLPDATENAAHRKALLTLSIDADYVLDLHCDWIATLHLFAHSEHKDVVMELAGDMNVSVVMLEDGVSGGPFDECSAVTWIKTRRALELTPEALPTACFSTTIELRGHCDVSDELGAVDAANIARFLMRRGVLAGDPGPLPAAPCDAAPLDGCDMVTVPCAGLIAWKRTLGEQVKIGDHLANIIDIAVADPTQARTPVMARQTGTLFSKHINHLARPGEVIGKISGKDPLAHRQGVTLLSNR